MNPVVIGNAMLYLGDCREILPTMSADCVLTDIPYHEVNRKSSGLRNLDKSDADECFGGEIEALMQVEASTFYVFCGVSQISQIRNSLIGGGYTVRLGGWEKTNPSPMNGTRLWVSGFEACVFGRRKGAVFHENCKTAIWHGPTLTETDHPTEKPLWLFLKLISASTNPENSVIDPFMGSGTAGAACANLGRKFIGIEKNPKYFEIACRRIEGAQRQGRLLA